MRKEREEQYKERIQRCLDNTVDINKGRQGARFTGKLTSKQINDLKSYYVCLKMGKTETKSGIKAKSFATFYEYIRNLRRFGLHIKKDFLKATVKDVESFINLYSDCSNSFLNMSSKNLKCFYIWLYKQNKREEDELIQVLKDMKFRKDKMEPKDASQLLTREEVLNIISKADDLRDKTIISVLAESACRVGEIVDLNYENVSFDKHGAFIDVVESKTKKRKIRLITSEPYLKRYKNEHRYRTGPLFYSRGLRDYGKRITSAGIRQLLRKYAKEAGITKPVNPHNFRHSELDRLGRNGWTDRDLTVRAGWTSSQMAAVYLHYEDDHVNNKYDEMMGIEKDEEEAPKINVLQPIECLRCGNKNPADAKYCNCGMVLDENEVVNVGKYKEELMTFILENKEMMGAMLGLFKEQSPEAFETLTRQAKCIKCD